MARDDKSIPDLFDEVKPIQQALRTAVREALLHHKKIGNPIAVWEDGRLIWIPPEEIDPAAQDDADPS